VCGKREDGWETVQATRHRITHNTVSSYKSYTPLSLHHQTMCEPTICPTEKVLRFLNLKKCLSPFVSLRLELIQSHVTGVTSSRRHCKMSRFPTWNNRQRENYGHSQPHCWSPDVLPANRHDTDNVKMTGKVWLVSKYMEFTMV